MMLGLPWTAWLLLIIAVGLGLAIELRFFFHQRRTPSHPEAHHGDTG